MTKRQERLQQIEQAVKKHGDDTSVQTIADELDLSKSYIRELVNEAQEEGLIPDSVGGSQMTREERIQQVVAAVEKKGGEVSVKDLADELDLSKGYVRGLADEARTKGLINGEKSVPVLGYIFDRDTRARADGGDRDGELRVLPTRAALLQAVRDHAPHLLSEARGKPLDELRKFVRDRVADGVTPITHAWRFEPV